jgi:hypothetical protein
LPAAQHGPALTVVPIPEPHAPVVATAGDSCPIAAHRYRDDPPTVPAPGHLTDRCLQFPQAQAT